MLSVPIWGRNKVLQVNNIEVVYQSAILTLRGVSLEVPTGAIVALLGANGAGKSTTLKAISGLLSIELGSVTRGNIQFEGKRIDGLRPYDIVKMGIVQVMEGRKVLEQLTAEENLKAGAFIAGDGTDFKKKLDMVYSYFPRLKDLKNAISGYCSGGEQQMLVMGRALMAGPKILLLDEPSLGLSPVLVQEIFNIVRHINAESKISILIVEQNARAALDLAQHGYVMENGRMVLDDTAEKLKDNEDIREFYFGMAVSGEKASYRELKFYKRRKRWLG